MLASRGGTLNQIKINCGGAANLKVAVYSDNSGAPGSLLAANSASTPVVSGWNSLALDAVAVTSGTYYWLAFCADAAIVGTKSNTGSVRKYKSVDFSSFTFPNPAGSGFSNAANYYDLIGAWDNGYSYDANGNLLVGGGRTLTWNAENQPTSILKNGVTTTFVYDGDGRRVAQTVGATTTIYVNQYYEKTGAENTTSYYLGGKLNRKSYKF
jgi:YD repeat-containing protein